VSEIVFPACPGKDRAVAGRKKESTYEEWIVITWESGQYGFSWLGYRISIVEYGYSEFTI